AARRVQTKLTLLIALQRAGDSVNIAQIKSGRVNQSTIAFFGRNFKSPQNGFSERIFYRAPLVSIVAFSPKAFVRGNQQNAWASAFESHNMILPELSSIQTDIIRSDACG